MASSSWLSPLWGAITLRLTNKPKGKTMQIITAKIIDNNLVISVPLNRPAQVSKSGKSKVVASSYGNQVIADCTVEGQPVTVGVNAYIRNR